MSDIYRTTIIGLFVMTGAPFILAGIATIGMGIFLSQEGIIISSGIRAVFFVIFTVTIFPVLRDLRI